MNDIDAAIAATANNGRQPMNMDAAKLGSVGMPKAGKLVKKGNTQAGVDPSVGTKVQRMPVMQERLGARYAIGIKWPAKTSPEAGYTQANGRVVKGRPGDNSNFWDQASRKG